ncbi:unnamed protein product [Brachionus calyciflorus]|uniref:PRA1 family protein n=1 Tax=Brachionus calyciflorus TaxID=104777 RepID=A0A814GQS6_9BILA|nr:unnamed protein product [Brachionus calyciflorus]
MIHPVQFLTGLFIFVVLFVGAIALSNNYHVIQRLKRDKPFVNLAMILLLSGFLFNLFGSLLTFLFSICLPLTVIFVHAGLRLRNLKNKIENKKEFIGVTRTPMGVLLQSLDFMVNEKLKE